MTQKDKGNLQKMINKFVEIVKTKLNIELSLNTNYAHK